MESDGVMKTAAATKKCDGLMKTTTAAPVTPKETRPSSSNEREPTESPGGCCPSVRDCLLVRRGKLQPKERTLSYFSGKSYYYIRAAALIFLVAVATFVTVKFARRHSGEVIVNGSGGEAIAAMGNSDQTGALANPADATAGGGVPCFDDPLELKQAVDYYLLAKQNHTFQALYMHKVGNKYGKSISNFCFTKEMTDMSNLFDARRNPQVEWFDFPDDISQWDVSHVERMDGMFSFAKEFNKPIGKWNTRNVRNMSSLFLGAFSFNQDLSAWDTSNVEDMSSMFKEAAVFNHPIHTWKMSNVKTTHSMFYMTGSFNSNLGHWDTSNIQDMTSMFAYAQVFNNPTINDWDVSNVRQMTQMFNKAPVFNQPLDKWKPRKVVRFTRMFANAERFNQNLCAWGSCCFDTYAKTQAMFSGTNCSTTVRTHLHTTPISPLCHVCT